VLVLVRPSEHGRECQPRRLHGLRGGHERDARMFRERGKAWRDASSCGGARCSRCARGGRSPRARRRPSRPSPRLLARVAARRPHGAPPHQAAAALPHDLLVLLDPAVPAARRRIKQRPHIPAISSCCLIPPPQRRAVASSSGRTSPRSPRVA
jgi:hypothetical protein